MAAMSEQPSAQPARNPDKLLAIGAYGEMVAAYRYLVLAEKCPIESLRADFADMADEEQGHKQTLEQFIAEFYPDADFVLTAEDKELVVTGPRVIDVRDRAAFADVMRMVLETERKTAAFYARHGKQLADPRLRRTFHELAEEGVEHHQRLKDLVQQAGLNLNE